MADIRAVASGLESARKTFMQKLEANRTQWLDSVGQNFEKNYVAPLPGYFKAMQQELERLGQLIEQAKREVK